MGRTAIAVFVSLVVALQNPTEAFRFAAHDEEISTPTVARPNKVQHFSNGHHAKEWIAAPNGYLYQFHAGEQSWLAAREFCLSQNSDLVILRDKEQIDWLLGHYAPTYARFSERYIQVGLMIPDGPNREWMYLDGSKYNQSVIAWMSGEPFDHSADGLERCALLRVHARLLDDVDCEASFRNQMPVRFICERTGATHKKQVLSDNFIWKKLEQLLEFFGFANGETPKKGGNSTFEQEEDYEDEVRKQNFSSSESAEFKKIKFETSSEEEREVQRVLKKLGTPGHTAQTESPKTEAATSPEILQEVRPQSSAELQGSESTTLGIVSSATTEEQTTGSVQEETATSAGTVAAAQSSSGRSESSTVIVESEATTAEAEESTTTVEAAESTTASVAEETATAEGSSTSAAGENNVLARARAAPLREITEREGKEGSGADVERSEIEKDPKDQREIDPEKLEKVISTMEKMIANLEKISVVERNSKSKQEKQKEAIDEKKTETKQAVKENDQRRAPGNKKESHDSVSTGTEKLTEDTVTVSEMEKDFDEDLNKNMPTTDLKPPTDDDCEEGSGEKTTTESPPEAVVKNAVDTEDVDDLSQKPKIPAEKEEHVQDFLKTLRTFLNRAEHNDLRKLLDDNPGKSLLEKMKLAIKAANEREFGRMKELELLKEHGVDISNVTEPKLMDDSEREDLFKKISGVVLAEAEKQDLEAVTEPSARTTTQESARLTTGLNNERSKEGVGIWSSKEYTADEAKKEAKENSEKRDDDSLKKAEADEKRSSDAPKREDNVDKEKMTEEKQVKDEDAAREETTEVPKTSAEIPVRTVMLKEFDNKEEIMSKEGAEMPSRTITLKEFDNKEEIMSKEEKLEREGKAEEVKEEKKKSEEKVEKAEEVNELKKKSSENAENVEEHEEETVKMERIKPEKKHKKNEALDSYEKTGTEGEEKKASGSSEGSSTKEENDSFDSNEVDRPDRSEARENLEEEVAVTDIPEGDLDDHGVEVGTEKTPEAKREEKRRLQKEKNAQKAGQQKKTKDETKKVEEKKDSDEDDDDEKDRNSSNPLGLPTLPPPPTLPPLPSFEKVLENLGEQWKKLFPPPKPFRL